MKTQPVRWWGLVLAAAALLALATLAPAILAAAPAAAASLLGYHRTPAPAGSLAVPGLAADKARPLHAAPGFSAAVPAAVYAQPLLWQPPGGQAMLVVATEANVVLALDADTGKELWRRALPAPARRQD